MSKLEREESICRGRRGGKRGRGGNEKCYCLVGILRKNDEIRKKREEGKRGEDEEVKDSDVSCDFGHMGTCLKCPKNGQNKHVPMCPNWKEECRCMRGMERRFEGGRCGSPVLRLRFEGKCG